MANVSKFKISYANMKKIILEYYRQQGKKVSVNFSIQNSDDKYWGNTFTMITIIEKISLAGVPANAETVLNQADLIEILNAQLAKDEKEVYDLIDNVYSYETSTGGYMDGNTEVKTGTKTIVDGKFFTVKVREKQDVKTRTLKPAK